MKLYLLLLFCSVFASSAFEVSLDELELEEELRKIVEQRKRDEGWTGGVVSDQNDPKRGDKTARKALMAKLREAKKNCKGTTVPCPVCGSDRKIYWNGTCQLLDESCPAGGQVYQVGMKACLRKRSPVIAINREYCGVDDDVAVTVNRCDFQPKQCQDSDTDGDSKPKFLHPGQCGNCTEANVCTRLPRKMMKKWKQCDENDFSSPCDFLVARCKQFNDDGTVLKKKKCGATTPAPSTSPEPEITSNPEVTTSPEETADMNDPKKGSKGTKLVTRAIIKKFNAQSKECKTNKTVPCPVCGSDRVLNFEGFCDMRAKTCAGDRSVFKVGKRSCFYSGGNTEPKVPAHVCLKVGEASQTFHRLCDINRGKCAERNLPKGTKFIHFGKCGNCSEDSVCTKFMKQPLTRCPLRESMCKYQIKKCEQFQAEGTILKIRCKPKKTTVAPVTTSTAAPVTTSTEAPTTSTEAPATSTSSPSTTDSAPPLEDEILDEDDFMLSDEALDELF